MGPNYSSKVPCWHSVYKTGRFEQSDRLMPSSPRLQLDRKQKIQFTGKAECSSYVLPPRFSIVSVFIVIGLPSREHLTASQTIEGRKGRKVWIVIVVQPPGGIVYIVFGWNAALKELKAESCAEARVGAGGRFVWRCFTGLHKRKWEAMKFQAAAG